MTGFLEIVLSFVLVLGILVFVHELGHFLFARLFRVAVPVFSFFGVGPRLLGFSWRGTDFRVSAIPLGGYVRLAGEEAEERTGSGGEIQSKPRWQRLVIFAAGAVFNLILALLVTWVVIWAYGKDDRPFAKTFPVVAEVRPGSPAAAAGIQVEDRVVSIGGKDARDPQTEGDEVFLSPSTSKPVVVERGKERLELTMNTGSDPRYHLGDPGWRLIAENPGQPVIDMVMSGFPAERAGIVPGDRVLGADGQEPIDEVRLRAILTASAGREVALKIGRDRQVLDLRVTPRSDGGRGVVGVVFKTSGLVHLTYGPLGAAAESVRVNLELSKTLFKTLRKLVRREISMRAFSGPIEIARVSREAVKRLESFLAFLAFVSLQLGILNLLPIPVLDGGHLLILCVEGIIRRDLSEIVKERVMQAGLAFLLLFFGVIIYFDVIKTFFSS
ncbi:MAG: RIP metalloprotease RseP [Acidobacteriia bacterium]|nr:RIP metalloprotease RseP [Terriglobia bacterium]